MKNGNATQLEEDRGGTRQHPSRWLSTSGSRPTGRIKRASRCSADLISYCKLILNTENYVIFRGPRLLSQEHGPARLPEDDGPCQDRGVHAHPGLED